MDEAFSYINSLISENQNVSDIIAALAVLSELLDSNNEVKFRESLISSGLCASLIMLLKQPNQLKGQSAQDLNQTDTDNDDASSLDNNQPLICRLAMKCLKSIYSVNLSMIFQDSALMTTLFSYISPYARQHFYQFSTKYNSRFKELINNCGGNVEVIMHCNARIDVHTKELFLYEPDLVKNALVDAIYLSSVKVPSGVVVSDNLLDQALAWKKMPNFKSLLMLEEKQPHEIWQKSFVTRVLNGNFFWMLYGEDSIKTAEKIQDFLNTQSHELMKVEPKVFDIVAAKIEIDTESKLFRACIISEESGSYTVFALDSGNIYQVTDVYFLPPEWSDTNIPALAVLGYIEGVLPVPLDSTTVELAIATLSSIIRYDSSIIDQVLKAGILDFLPNLMVCSDLELVTESFCLGAHLLIKEDSQCCQKWIQIISIALDTLQKCVTNESLTHYCLLLLANRLFMCPVAKNHFYDVKGLDIVMHTGIIFRENRLIHETVVQVLANFVHNNRQHPIITHSISLQEYKAKQLQTTRRPNAAVKGFGYEDSSDESSSDESENEDLKNRPDFTAHEEKTHYILGEKVLLDPVENDIGLSCNMSAEYCVKTFCGMLNTGLGGKIYFGIGEDGVVNGEKLSHILRDELRLGMDEFMTQISPAVMHSHYEIDFIPVITSDGQDTDLCVIVMSCKPFPNTVYLIIDDNSYYRSEANTLVFSHHDIREKCVLEEESKHLDEIKELKKELAQLKKRNSFF
ncbi:uncharacterized protein LOC131937725 [Physella acuta]|uniref:uncharacterized protein LOC131937725 n=1 Tax=Physella acuta TaxID=109671 RepID=UPI0027DB1310|nr:uncharacterized protein LOC131937725 [Physella acuta]